METELLRSDPWLLLQYLGKNVLDKSSFLGAETVIQCADGSMSVPTLVLGALCCRSPVYSSLQDDDCPCLVLPDAEIANVRSFFKALFGVQQKRAPLEEVTLVKCFDWLDWTPWMVCRDQPYSEDSQQVAESLLRQVVLNLPIEPSRPENDVIVPLAVATDQPMSFVKALSTSIKRKGSSVTCPICAKTLYDKHSLRKHEDAVHFNIRPHACRHCGKAFSLRNDLKDHVLAVHAKVKSCICDVCGVALATRHGLRDHKLTHESSTKSIVCAHCQKTFRHMSTYRKHVRRVHEFTPEQRVKCKHCGKLFNQQEGLVRHIKKFHSEENAQFSCDLCPSAFAYRYDLNRHRRRVHANKSGGNQQQQPDQVQQQAADFAQISFSQMAKAEESLKEWIS